MVSRQVRDLAAISCRKLDVGRDRLANGCIKQKQVTKGATSAELRSTMQKIAQEGKVKGRRVEVKLWGRMVENLEFKS